MKREEKNQQTRRRIMDSARKEFSEKGYGGSSVNTICSTGKISKGIIYHYFRTKDEIYLACVEECFRTLTVYLKNHICLENKDTGQQLEDYFSARQSFFDEYPVYQRIFCDAVMMPALPLQDQLREIKSEFDFFNIEIIGRLIEPLKLRSDFSKREVIDVFRQYQDYINAKPQMLGAQEMDLKAYEDSCRRALHILLYGVVERN